jgi:hypothetical protein
MFLQIIDSLTISQINHIAETVDAIQKKTTLSPWFPIMATIVGGILVWVGQFIERKYKRNQDLRKDIYETFTKCEMQLVFLKNLLRELATHKNLREFWWYSYNREFVSATKNAELEKKYYDSCLLSSEAAIKCDLKIGEILSDYYSNVSKFKILTGSEYDVSFIKELVVNSEFTDGKEIDKKLTNQQALAAYDTNRKQLAIQYLTKFQSIDALNETLKLIISKKK